RSTPAAPEDDHPPRDGPPPEKKPNPPPPPHPPRQTPPPASPGRAARCVRRSKAASPDRGGRGHGTSCKESRSAWRAPRRSERGRRLPPGTTRGPPRRAVQRRASPPRPGRHPCRADHPPDQPSTNGSPEPRTGDCRTCPLHSFPPLHGSDHWALLEASSTRRLAGWGGRAGRLLSKLFKAGRRGRPGGPGTTPGCPTPP